MKWSRRGNCLRSATVRSTRGGLNGKYSFSQAESNSWKTNEWEQNFMEIHLGIEIVESAGLFQVVCLPPNSDARGWDCIWIPCSKVIDYSSHEVPLSTSLEILNCHKSPLIRFILGSHHDQRHMKDLIRKLLCAGPCIEHWVTRSLTEFKLHFIWLGVFERHKIQNGYCLIV